MKTWWIGLMATALLASGCGRQETTPGETAIVNEPGMTAPNAAGETTTAPDTAGPTKLSEDQYRTLPGGLKYAVLQEGSGPAAEHQQVSVHYTGWLQDGTKFDSSRDRGQPFEFVLGHGDVIKGWDEGVKGMQVGEKRQLVVPPAMGYGERGTPDGTIPPNATLIFEVELLGLGAPHSH